jgi:predicted Rossmann fold flavoprotein
MKKEKLTYDTVIIGGGPSGMICAGKAAKNGGRVLLIEKNDSPGKKLLLTGGGRCNITNAVFDTETFLNNFPDSKKFLYSPFSKFNVRDTFNFFESLGLPLVTEARNRVFPETQKAQDVLNILRNYLQKNNVEILFKTKVLSLECANDKVLSIKTDCKKQIFAKNFVLATGGLAAPETGSTGDGLKFLESLGHKVISSNPDIVPLTTSAKWVHRLSGISWSFMKISFIQDDKIKLKKTGKILFTHFGISGPLILNTAREVKKLLKQGSLTASIDLFPDTDEGDLDKRVIKLFNKNLNMKIDNVLPEMIFKNIAHELLKLPDINLSGKVINSINREERKNLVKKMKNLTLPITGTLGFSHAVATDGGIALEEVDFKNMTSKKYPNLYLLGDVLNISRPSGGFSLQICWTTGAVAGKDIASK